MPAAFASAPAAPEVAVRATLAAARALVPLALAALPRALHAQADTLPLHFTLRGWADAAWLRIADRDALAAGAFSDRGILQRFPRTADAEYQLDFLSSAPQMSEEFRFQEADNAARWWGGSINYRQLITSAEAKVRLPLGRRFSFGARFLIERTPETRRNLVQLRAERTFGASFGYALINLYELKPSIDVELGGGHRWRGGEATLGLTGLDLANNFIYGGLGVDPGFADTVITYRRSGWLLRGAVRTRVVRGVRAEAYGGVMLPAEVQVADVNAPANGFVQRERYAYAGGVVEWEVRPAIRAGLFGTVQRAHTDRTPLAAGRPLDDYRLTERTAQAGVFVLARLAPRWRAEGRLYRQWRPERRTYRAVGGTNVDYADHAWLAQLSVRYGRPTGLQLELGYDRDARAVLRGDGQLPAIEPLGRDNHRIRFDVGWQLAQGFTVMAGSNWDLDGDAYLGRRRLFDGAHVRFGLFW